MKKALIFLMLLFFVLPAKVKCIEHNSTNGTQINTKICTGIKNKKKMDVFGVNFLSYNYAEIYQYILLNNTLFVLGRLTTSQVELSSINLSSKSFVRVGQYSISGNFPLKDFNFCVLSIQENNTETIYVVASYIDNRSGMRVQYTTSNIDIFKMENSSKFVMVKQANIMESNISLFPHPGTQYQYLQYAYNFTPEEVGTFRPAKKNGIRFVFSDVNMDGYIDILIWKINSISKNKADTRKEDFVFDSEELYAMYYDKNTKTFSNMTPINWE